MGVLEHGISSACIKTSSKRAEYCSLVRNTERLLLWRGKYVVQLVVNLRLCQRRLILGCHSDCQG